MPQLDRKNLIEFFKFSVIGISNVAVFLLLVIFFHYKTEFNEFVINGMCYLLSAVYSFCLNTIFTFKQPFKKLALVKFLIASILLSLTASAITAIIIFLKLQYWISLVVVIFGMPLLSFFLHKYWSFRA